MKKAAFSLMELLIVMVILAGLATMIIPNMGESQDAMVKRTMESDLRNALTEKQFQMLENGEL